LRFALCTLRFALCVLRFALCTLRFALCVLRFAFCVLRFELDRYKLLFTRVLRQRDSCGFLGLDDRFSRFLRAHFFQIRVTLSWMRARKS